MVPTAGVEPARLTPLPPQDSVSTNSTTSAKTLYSAGNGTSDGATGTGAGAASGNGISAA